MSHTAASTQPSLEWLAAWDALDEIERLASTVRGADRVAAAIVSDAAIRARPVLIAHLESDQAS